VCGHRWADLSEGDYGVSLLTDGTKYGYDVHDNVLRLTLLKGAVAPDPDADLGRHTFTYALLPHDGDWRMTTVDEALALNYPLLARFTPSRPGGLLPTTYTLATVDDTRVIIDTIKKAEDQDDALIIRLYEAMNTRGQATLTLGFEIADAWAVNLVEENPTPVPHTRNAIPFTYRPFEIKTFLVKPRR
jgi:alpha-mannosidase